MRHILILRLYISLFLSKQHGKKAAFINFRSTFERLFRLFLVGYTGSNTVNGKSERTSSSLNKVRRKHKMICCELQGKIRQNNAWSTLLSDHLNFLGHDECYDASLHVFDLGQSYYERHRSYSFCLLFSEILDSVLWHLSLILKNPQLLLFSYLLLLSLFSFCYLITHIFILSYNWLRVLEYSITFLSLCFHFNFGLEVSMNCVQHHWFPRNVCAMHEHTSGIFQFCSICFWITNISFDS